MDYQTTIMNSASTDIVEASVQPRDIEIETHHAFYYAIRSGNVEKLDNLINQYSDPAHPEALDNLLASAYEELKLKNVLLSDAIESLVEEKLVNLRFFSNRDGGSSTQTSIETIKRRIALLLEGIEFLKVEYSGEKEVDEKFLFISRFIAKNIRLLKRQLKSTYNKLPWEEIEFCLVIFISSHVKHQESNLLYNSVLSRERLLSHLHHFAESFKKEKINVEEIDAKYINKLRAPLKRKREEVIVNIVADYPLFKDLYNDYKQLRDIYYLNRIAYYIRLALQVDPRKKEGQLTIERALQVVGEGLKNTLDSPNLSSATSGMLLLDLPKHTRKIIIALRDSLSHAYSLSKRVEIERKADPNFFAKIQDDLKKFHPTLKDIIQSKRFETIRILLERILESQCADEMKAIAKLLNRVPLYFHEKMFKEVKTREHEKILTLISMLKNKVPEKTKYEEALFNKIEHILHFNQSDDLNFNRRSGDDYGLNLGLLKLLSTKITSEKIDDNYMRGVKSLANKLLKNITPTLKSSNLKEVSELVVKLYKCVKPRIPENNLNEIVELVEKIFFIAEFEAGQVKGIEALLRSLDRKKDKKSFLTMEAKQQEKQTHKSYLKERIVTLKNILNDKKLNEQWLKRFPSYKQDEALQAALEMLVLDIMAIMGDLENRFEENGFFLDQLSPLLIAKQLRNYLAHGDALIDILLFDPTIALISQAKKLIEEATTQDHKKIGQVVEDNPGKVAHHYHKNLAILMGQENLFYSIEKGGFEGFQACIKQGADIHARNIHGWTALHFAAKGSNLRIVKFLLDHNLSIDVKNRNDQNPLHIAAAYGRNEILAFFLESGLLVDVIDNHGETPLHLAAKNGHKASVEVLLKNKANTRVKNMHGFAPLHNAVLANHQDVVEILLERESNADVNEAMSAFTALHLASENGYLSLVNFLLDKKANVNAKTDKDATPLHIAALNGHLEVVEALILKGARVNAREMRGCTSLHYATETGREAVVKCLLAHGADANVADKIYHNTPLHYAVQDGHEGIVEALLKYKAGVNLVTQQCMTPLHLAAANGTVGIVNALLMQDVKDINAKNEDGATPLHFAAQNGHQEVVNALIKNKAEVNAQANAGGTPLHVAAYNGHQAIIELLIKNKSDVNAKTKSTITPLHLAALNGQQALIEILLKNKAEIDAQDKDNATPLHYAVQNGCKEVVKALLAKDANINTQNRDNFTALHMVAQTGDEEIADLLIKNKAGVNAQADNNMTALHLATHNGYKNIIYLLIKNKAEVNIQDITGTTPLHIAVEMGDKALIEILVENGADLHIKDACNHTLLFFAMKHHDKEMIEFLIRKGADVNAEGDEVLTLAVIANYRDILEILLKNRTGLTISDPQNASLLHLAAKSGHKEIAELLIAKGADVNAIALRHITPLYFAAQEGHKEVVEVLIIHGANVDTLSDEGCAPLHIAAVQGHPDVVEALLRGGATINIKDKKNRTAIDLGVAHGRLDVVKILLQHKEESINAKNNDNWRLLHIAAETGNLETTSYLIEKGADIHAKNISGSKAIHIAAREGHKNIVEFFLNKGFNINDQGVANQTLLHYAALGGQLEVVKYLIAQGIDVNTKDVNGATPLHLAVYQNHKDIVEVLLSEGSIYNAADNLNRTPLIITKNEAILNLLTLIKKLFEAVKENNRLEIENLLKKGVCVNAKNKENSTLLHYAAWKGYAEVVNVLLENKANPNALGKNGWTPLHYAVQFNHLEIVKSLLSSGAIYNAMDTDGKAPLDFADVQQEMIIGLLNRINKSFKGVQNARSRVIEDLKKIKAIDIIKAIMRACDREGQTLIVAAIHHNFPKIDQLKQLLQDNVAEQMTMADILLVKARYPEALNILQNIFDKTKDLFGLDNPATLDVQKKIAHIAYKQAKYIEALSHYNEIYQKQKKILGSINQDTLSTRGCIALVLYMQGKYSEALSLYEEVYQQQKETLGAGHSDVLTTQLHKALVLGKQGQYEEALNLNRDVFKKRKETLGANNPSTLNAQNNMAMVFMSQGKDQEALKIYQEVLKRKKLVLGINHPDTLRTQQHIAGILYQQKQYNEALHVYQEVLDIQKNVLGIDHFDTLNTQHHIGDILFSQGRFIAALKAYEEGFDQRKVILGPDHPDILNIRINVKAIDETLKYGDPEGRKGVVNILAHIQGDTPVLDKHFAPLQLAVKKGDLEAVKTMLKEEQIDINALDSLGNRSALHFASESGYLEMVCILLQNGSDIEAMDINGATALHYAAHHNHKEVVNALLENGANVNAVDYYNNKAGDLTTDVSIKDILRLTQELFIAITMHDLQKIKILVQKGGIINATIDGNRLTLLHHAAYSGDVTLIEFLIDKGSSINFPDRAGWTALHYAAQRGQKDIVEALINNGANVGAKDNCDKTPLALAGRGKYRETITVLLKHLERDSHVIQSHRCQSRTYLGASKFFAHHSPEEEAEINQSKDCRVSKRR